MSVPGTAGAAPPPAGTVRPAPPPALEGDLSRFGAGEVLHWLRWAQASGRVEFARGEETLALLLDEGRLVQASSDARAVRTGEVLVHRRQVTPQMLAVALAEQRERGGRIGERLIADGVAEPAAVRRAVEECTRRIVYRLLLWSDGRFRFVPGVRAAVGGPPVELDLEQLVLDGLRIADSAPVVESAKTL